MAKPAQTDAPPSEVLMYFRLLAFAGSTWLDIVLMVVGAICAAASGVPFPLMAILFGELVDDLNAASCEVSATGSGYSYGPAINSRVLQLVYIAVGAFVVIFIYIICWSLLSQRLAHRLRTRYFQSLLHQDMAFFDEHQSGEVSVRLNADVQAVQSGTCEKVGIFIASLSFFITAYVIAFTRQARLAGMLVSLIPAFVLVAVIGGAFFQKFTAYMSAAAESAASTASEALSHVDIVQAFGAEKRLERRFAENMSVACQAGIKKGAVAATQAGLLYFIAYSANALAFWQGSRMIADLVAGRGGASVGEVYTVVFILVDACVVLGSTAPLLPLFGSAASAFVRLRRVIDREPLVDDRDQGGRTFDMGNPGTFRLSNIAFSYPSRPDDEVLCGIDIEFPAGKRTAIVGPSGSGKSTIVSLLTRFYNHQQGQIFLDGFNLREFNLHNLRGLMGIVQQEPTLLNCSIFDNIALGLIGSSWPGHKTFQDFLLKRLSSSLDKTQASAASLSDSENPIMKDILALVQKAAASAEAAVFIESLEHGYESVVGPGGKSLSGGQRQRIALARALIRDPKVLILDEATAALDSITERRIQATLDRVSVGRTVLAIAHRLSTVKDADNIIVLKDGRVEQQGTYEQLLNEGGVFADMVKLQELTLVDENETISLASTSHPADLSSIKLEKSRSIKGEYDPQDKTLQASDQNQTTSASTQTLTESTARSITSKMTKMAVLRDVGRYIKPSRAWILMAVLAAVIVGGTYSAAGLIFGHTVGALNLCDTTIDRILYVGRFFGGLLFMLAVIEFFANLVSWSSFAVVAERLLYSLRVLSFRALFEQSYEWHHSEGRDPSSLLSILTKDNAAIGAFSGSTIGTIFSILVNFVVAIILSLIIAWKIAIVCIAVVPILLGSGIMQLYSHSRFEERHARAFARSVGISVETVASIKAITSFSLQKMVMKAYEEALAGPRTEIITASIYTNVWLAISNTTGFFIYAFAYWWGSQQIMRGENSQQQFFIILVAMLVSAQLWGQMFTLAPEVSRARASASRVLSLVNLGSSKYSLVSPKDLSSYGEHAGIDIESNSSTEKSPIVEPRHGMSVSFESVDFSYPTSAQIPVLQNATLKIHPGQFCGLVGASGAGKSTIMRLILRMYQASSGSVTLDGMDIGRAGVDNDIAYVPQDNALFSGTIKFNVGLGARPGYEATDGEIQEACRIANIHDTIMTLPDQYNTECGPNGSHLSGGQRQRLAIARALVRKPRLLLLDESTSALDAESEKALQDGLERAVKTLAMTVIAITHRLHTVLKADVVFVIEGGKVADSGKHEELLARNESYRINAQSQML
ncbi:hypothetical protein PV10_05615 [Exophiala mesophila]|uniref:Leptomycin B resistance protein pmd1 n=1 Tax=Exophiala mesophila TaxID=212818 RepID=A0A0D1WPS4_EXOME|nr:uncharacterized protein PV10_05615 [Exophiala mesophila]KIV91025.1 hypothetical protein PV10_05615 [Exophiala mesophila]